MAQPVIKLIAAARVVSIRSIIPSYSAPAPMWGKLHSFLGKNGIKPVGPPFSIYYDDGYKERDVDVEACFPIAEDAKVPTDKEIKVTKLPEIPEAVSLTHKGPYTELPETYGTIFKWIGTHGKTPAGPSREIYHVMEGDQKDFVTEVVVPVH